MGFESVEDLRARIAESVTSQKADMMPRLKENACLYALAERVEGDVPEAMPGGRGGQLDPGLLPAAAAPGREFRRLSEAAGITPDRFKEDVKAQAADMTKQDLALDAWARHYSMEVTDEDVAGSIANAESYLGLMAKGMADPANQK